MVPDPHPNLSVTPGEFKVDSEEGSLPGNLKEDLDVGPERRLIDTLELVRGVREGRSCKRGHFALLRSSRLSL